MRHHHLAANLSNAARHPITKACTHTGQLEGVGSLFHCVNAEIKLRTARLGGKCLPSHSHKQNVLSA